jgi:hypothetical protein
VITRKEKARGTVQKVAKEQTLFFVSILQKLPDIEAEMNSWTQDNRSNRI